MRKAKIKASWRRRIQRRSGVSGGGANINGGSMAWRNGRRQHGMAPSARQPQRASHHAPAPLRAASNGGSHAPHVRASQIVINSAAIAGRKWNDANGIVETMKRKRDVAKNMDINVGET